MKKLAILMLLLVGCSGGKEPDGEAQSGEQGGSSTATSLTGLYEGGAADPRNRMCIVEGEGGDARFGLVVWGGGMHSCSGTGTAARRGDVLALQMAGDESCTIEAKMNGGTVTLPATLPEGCAYYCGARASFANVRFARVGTTVADAGKARDLVGDPLCAATRRSS